MADFIKIFPFIFGAAISPVLLVTVLYILSRPTQPIKKALVYLLAGTITISTITAIIFYSTQIRLLNHSNRNVHIFQVNRQSSSIPNYDLHYGNYH